MAARSSLSAFAPERESGVRLPSARFPLTDGPSRIEYLENTRFLAANSTESSVRSLHLNYLADIDSLAMVIESTSYEDTRSQAISALSYRLSTYPDASLSHLASNANSKAIQAAASEENEKRKLNI